MMREFSNSLCFHSVPIQQSRGKTNRNRWLVRLPEENRYHWWNSVI